MGTEYGGGTAPLACSTSSDPMLRVPPDEVWADGDVQPQTVFGYEPPMARSRTMEKPWSMAACQVPAPTWLSLTIQT